MTYIVVAAYATAETNVGSGRARVDFPRGAFLPADVPAEDLDRLVRVGEVEKVSDEVEDLTDDEDGDGIPDGSIPVVLAWVGTDIGRARTALSAEELKGDKARMGLVNELTKLVQA